MPNKYVGVLLRALFHINVSLATHNLVLHVLLVEYNNIFVTIVERLSVS